jgi:hypothetical protein
MEQQIAEQLKQLSQDYYNRNISHEDYRLERRKLIDVMDKEFNGAQHFHHD